MWFKTEKDLDLAIAAFEDEHGILRWTDGRDAASVKSLFGGLILEADGEDVIARAHVCATRFQHGGPAYVLSKALLSDEVVQRYLDLITSPVGRPSPRHRGEPKRKRKSRAKPKPSDSAPDAEETGPDAIQDAGPAADLVRHP